MTALDRFPVAVAAEIRLRAERFAAEGKVDLSVTTDNAVNGEVFDGGRRFDTVVAWNNGSPWLSECGCEVFEREQLCPHVVATAIAAEKEGYLPAEGPKETKPRRGDRGPVWLSSSGKLKRLDEEEQPRPVIEHRPSLPSWRKQLARVRESAKNGSPIEPWPADREVLYVVDLPASADSRALVIRLAARDRKASGDWSKPKTRGVSFPDISGLRDRADQQVLALLKAAGPRNDQQPNYDPVYRVPDALQKLLLPMVCATGRALVLDDSDNDEMLPLTWEEGAAWEFWLEGTTDELSQQHVLSGWFRRGNPQNGTVEKAPASRPNLVLGGGILVMGQMAGVWEDAGAFAWVSLFRSAKTIQVPVAQSAELLSEMLTLSRLPRMDLPAQLQVDTVQSRPKPYLRVREAGTDEFRPERLRAELAFDYGGTLIRQSDETGRTTFDAQRRRMIVRDLPAEAEFLEQLKGLGLRDAMDYSRGGPELWFNQRHLPRLIRTLVPMGWKIEAEGHLYRQAGPMTLRVSSGMDWFELHGEVEFEGQHVGLPALLAALKKGESAVKLADGTLGLLPESWLKKYAILAAVAESGEGEDFLKFGKTQVGLLDALLASAPEATWDEAYGALRTQLRTFEGIKAKEAPAGFVGELRPYQGEGLGWFEFLRRFGFGGCLADDMGLGKTVQVLALLAGRKQAGADGNGAPSLVVVPKSLVFNWQQEAARFAPQLRLLDHTGIDRLKSADHLKDYDVVVTTYGTLRRDAAFLKDVTFDYVVLDEAQAIKNPQSESAKAVRLVKGRHRLALSGTPVQNHLGDLWSLFDFLNPGMLGAASVFSELGGGAARVVDEDSRQVLSRALRPFILRRTKEQVARDLPPKLEQTLYCELDATQRKLYDELREHYRRSLLSQVDREGLGRSKFQILEALLRLRQAALHPGLLDRARANEPSAKLDLLLPRLREVMEEGHKALVFSQFTSMLALVREQLDKEGIVYEYLDGKTKDREARVMRFQSDASCKLFLISLKAGGLGLNLTAADYVFLLDPWWNPAVEAQAIDRAHRIGQTNQVFACRLIAKDTVEEKVLALQQSKRDLADAIINADNSLLRTLGRDDLELLLS